MNTDSRLGCGGDVRSSLREFGGWGYNSEEVTESSAEEARRVRDAEAVGSSPTSPTEARPDVHRGGLRFESKACRLWPSPPI